MYYNTYIYIYIYMLHMHMSGRPLPIRGWWGPPAFAQNGKGGGLYVHMCIYTCVYTHINMCVYT